MKRTGSHDTNKRMNPGGQRLPSLGPSLAVAGLVGLLLAVAAPVQAPFEEECKKNDDEVVPDCDLPDGPGGGGPPNVPTGGAECSVEGAYPIDHVVSPTGSQYTLWLHPGPAPYWYPQIYEDPIIADLYVTWNLATLENHQRYSFTIRVGPYPGLWDSYPGSEMKWYKAEDLVWEAGWMSKNSGDCQEVTQRKWSVVKRPDGEYSVPWRSELILPQAGSTDNPTGDIPIDVDALGWGIETTRDVQISFAHTRGESQSETTKREATVGAECSTDGCEVSGSYTVGESTTSTSYKEWTKGITQSNAVTWHHTTIWQYEDPRMVTPWTPSTCVYVPGLPTCSG